MTEVASEFCNVLALPAGSRILDVPCGQGRHAHPLAEAGFYVEGLDYSKHLIDKALARGTGPTLKYTRGDMRKLPSRWTGRFDAGLVVEEAYDGFRDRPLTRRSAEMMLVARK